MDALLSMCRKTAFLACRDNNNSLSKKSPYATHYVDEKRIAQLKTLQRAAAEDRAALNGQEALSPQFPGS